MITALTRLGMTVLLVAALTAGTDTQTRKADATAGAHGSAKARPPATAITAPADAAAEAQQAVKDAAAKDLAPLPIELPRPQIPPTLKNLPPGVRVAIPHNQWRPRKPFLAPKGCVNVARGRRVSASDNEPVIGELSMITDGDKAGGDGSFVDLGPGVQWVQIDLGSALAIHAIVLWHEHRQPLVYHDVVIQVSDDRDFITNVRTLFNNDHDNSAGMGIGEDWGYFEMYEGELFEAKGVRARYVRLYSNGSTGDDLNRYTEVEVYAIPAEAGHAASPASAPGGKEVGARQDRRPGEAGPPKL
jgi:hypothetical protein